MQHQIISLYVNCYNDAVWTVNFLQAMCLYSTCCRAQVENTKAFFQKCHWLFCMHLIRQISPPIYPIEKKGSSKNAAFYQRFQLFSTQRDRHTAHHCICVALAVRASVAWQWHEAPVALSPHHRQATQWAGAMWRISCCESEESEQHEDSVSTRAASAAPYVGPGALRLRSLWFPTSLITTSLAMFLPSQHCVKL